MDPLLGQCADEYLLADILGRGAFGKVYLALQLPLLMPTALKLLMRPAQDEEMAGILSEKFRGEALSLSRLDHPNVVRLLKYGEFSGAPFIVMEYVRGARTLRQELDQRAGEGRPLEIDEVVHILAQVLAALQAAHETEVVHRDIKPDNVMLQRVSGDPYFVRVVDFGLAKFVDQGRSTNLTAGTPAYMAPEQFKGSNIGPWSDVYAVGLIAIEMLTGRVLFENTAEVMLTKNDPGFDPTSVLSQFGLSPELVAVLRTATAYAVRQRYASASAFRDALASVSGVTEPRLLGRATRESRDVAPKVPVAAVAQPVDDPTAPGEENHPQALGAEWRTVVLLAIVGVVALAGTLALWLSGRPPLEDTRPRDPHTLSLPMHDADQIPQGGVDASALIASADTLADLTSLATVSPLRTVAPPQRDTALVYAQIGRRSPGADAPRVGTRRGRKGPHGTPRPKGTTHTKHPPRPTPTIKPPAPHGSRLIGKNTPRMLVKCGAWFVPHTSNRCVTTKMNGIWYPVAIVKREGERFLVHYLNNPGTLRWWVSRQDLRFSRLPNP